MTAKLAPVILSVLTEINYLDYEEEERYAEAEPMRRRSLEIKERSWRRIVPHLLAEALVTYAALLRKLNRDAGAEGVEACTRPIRAKYPKGNYRRQLPVMNRPGR